MAVSYLEWETWLERLYNLRRDKRGSHERPHKPVLLLSIIDLLDRGVIAGNEVSSATSPSCASRTINRQSRIHFSICAGTSSGSSCPRRARPRFIEKVRPRVRRVSRNYAGALLTADLLTGSGR